MGIDNVIKTQRKIEESLSETAAAIPSKISFFDHLLLTLKMESEKY